MSNFGRGAEVVESDKVLPEGDYEIKLGMPNDVQAGGFNIRKIPFKVRGMTNVMPNSWDWFDIPTGDIEKMHKWNKAMTKNCDAFGVKRLDFEPSHWAGKTGFVHIGKNTKTGYMEVKWAVLKEEMEKKVAEPEPVKKEDDYNDNGYQNNQDNDPYF